MTTLKSIMTQKGGRSGAFVDQTVMRTLLKASLIEIFCSDADRVNQA